MTRDARWPGMHFDAEPPPVAEVAPKPPPAGKDPQAEALADIARALNRIADALGHPREGEV